LIVCQVEAADYVVLEGVYSPFGRVDSVVGWFHEVKFAICLLQIFAEGVPLAVGDIDPGLVAPPLHVLEYFIKLFDDGGVSEVLVVPM
jgi:hypothetical protein